MNAGKRSIHIRKVLSDRQAFGVVCLVKKPKALLGGFRDLSVQVQKLSFALVPPQFR